MDSVETALDGAAQIRARVLETLAQRDRLEPDAASISEHPLMRQGRVCGVHFALRGPRNVLLTAIWDAETGTLWCYDSRGVRFQTTRIGAEAA